MVARRTSEFRDGRCQTDPHFGPDQRSFTRKSASKADPDHARGDMLELVFASDEPAELHLHGYDIYLSVEAGIPAVLRVDAKIAGRFPLESHRFGDATAQATGAHAHIVLLYLYVYPR
jgi:hypothetical protein